MLYGFRHELTLVVAAATTLAEYLEAKFTQEPRIPDFIDMMSEAMLSKLTEPVYVFEHGSLDQQDAFAFNNNVTIIGRMQCIERQMLMMLADNPSDNPYKKRAEGEERVTIAEAYGLDKDDPYDRRSDEEKEAEAEHKKKVKEMLDKAKADDRLTDESFGPQKDGLHVTDVRATKTADGKVEVTDVIAVKDEEGDVELPDDMSIVEDARILGGARKTVKASGPRPWNHDVPADADPNTIRKDYKGEEFIYAGVILPKGVLVYITPHSYFEEHDKPYSATYLDIVDRFALQGLTEIEPGIFESRHLTYLQVQTLLGNKGMKENMFLQLWLNNRVS